MSDRSALKRTVDSTLAEDSTAVLDISPCTKRQQYVCSLLPRLDQSFISTQHSRQFIQEPSTSANPSTPITAIHQHYTQYREEIDRLFTALSEPCSIPELELVDLHSFESNHLSNQIYNLIQKENVVVALPPNINKTILSLSVIELFNSLQRNDNNPIYKTSVILVPSSCSVIKKTQFINTHSKLHTNYTEDINIVEDLQTEFWTKKPIQADIVVMTASTLMHLLNKKYVLMSEFNLVVFDECHSICSDQSHRLFLHTYWTFNAKNISWRTLGVTSLSNFNKDNLCDSLCELQNKLLSKAVVSNMQGDICLFKPPPTETVVYFDASLSQSMPHIYDDIHKKCPELAQDLYCQLNVLSELCNLFGSWCVERLLDMTILWYLRKLKCAALFKTSMPVHDSSLTSCHNQKNDSFFECNLDCSKAVLYFDTRDIISQAELLDDPLFSNPLWKTKLNSRSDRIVKFCTDHIVSSKFGLKHNLILPCTVSSKFQSLVDILNWLSTIPKACGIVMMKMTSHIKIIQFMIASHPNLIVLKPLVLNEPLGMDTSDNSISIDAFRKGNCNLLITTWIPEEICDITPIHVVIQYDADMQVSDYKQYQKRQCFSESQFIVLMGKSAKDEPNCFMDIQQKESQMHAMPIQLLLDDHQQAVSSKLRCDQVTGMSLESTLDSISSPFSESPLVAPCSPTYHHRETLDTFTSESLSQDITYEIPNSNSVIRLADSIRILHEYCATLTVNNVQYKPQYRYMQSKSLLFYVEIVMPDYIRQECQKTIGPENVSKKIAKRMAALKLVKQLHLCGELDKFLEKSNVTALAKTRKKMHDQVEPASITPSFGSFDIFPLNIPTVFDCTWTVDACAWLSIIIIRTDSSRPVKLTKQNDVVCASAKAFKESLEASSAIQHTSNLPTITDIPLQIGIVTCGKDNAQTEFLDLDFHGESKQIQILTLEHQFKLTLKNIASFKKYHFHVFSGILRSSFDEASDWGMLCVPIDISVVTSLAFNPLTTLADNVIDWDELKFSKHCDNINVMDIMCDPLEPFTGHCDMVLFDRLQYSRKYTVLDVCYDKNPSTVIPKMFKFNTVKSYYMNQLKYQDTIKDDQPLIRGLSIPPPVQTKQLRLVNHEAYLLPQFLGVYPIKRTHLHQALVLPLITQKIWHYFLARDIKYGYGLTLANQAFTGSQFSATPKLLQIATTSSASNMGYSYERLETLGDSFLKIHQSLHLFCRNPFKNEGWMTQQRIKIEKNQVLHQKALDAGLQHFILTKPLTKRNWVPPAKNIRLNQEISNKTLAGSIEAVIGACVEEGGVEQAALAVSRLLSDEYETDWSNYHHDLYTSIQASPSSTDYYESVVHVDTIATKQIEEQIGYTFRDKTLLWEALTHSGTGKLGSMFQRLEFLGDAVLSYLAMQHLYKITPPLNPGGLSKLRAELVCNQFLACVSIQIGLVKYIRHTDMTMEAAIGRFTAWVQGYLASESSTPLPISTSATQIASARLFWNKGNTAPKTAGDVYESMLGAVFVDSQFDIHCVQSMFDITVISPWWWRFTSLFGGESMIYENPVAELRTLSYSLFKCVKIDYTYVFCRVNLTTTNLLSAFLLNTIAKKY
ncbi:hypothetical protein, variant 1 [Batrachochytrium dendrobatidis JEL423]|uniref:Dicer-like protein 1 n=2 Tax=Batrachochytrium dendrobatidis (strain JEL423) TaxID=403673 RepID=A0A177WPB9_BATDL|nr:hypothetical protein, variant 1 [Batrachochytrium dendrobatidis JEL423]